MEPVKRFTRNYPGKPERYFTIAECFIIHTIFHCLPVQDKDTAINKINIISLRTNLQFVLGWLKIT
jgi:hypothetical protein